MNSEEGMQLSLDIAVSFADRLIGLFSKRAKGDVLLIAPCHSIHTFGMREPIDIAFIDKGGNVVEVCESLSPWRIKRCGGAFAVLERRAGGMGKEKRSPWFKVGEEISLCIRK